MTSSREFGFGNSTLKKKLNSYKNSIYDNIQEGSFVDVSNRWINFLSSDKKMNKNSFILWDLGGRGSGKTATVFKDTTLLLKNPKRNVCFWKTPQALVDNIESYCLDELKGRYRKIDKLRSIKQNDIFIIDEGLIGANAKEALKKEMRNLIKFLSKSRHMNIIGYINSISHGILSQFRDTIDIVVYRRLPKMFIKNHKSSDFILKTYGDQLTLLKEHESILISSYKRFDVEGYLSIKLEDHCSWFNDKISMYQQNVSADTEFDDEQKIQEDNTKIVEWLIRTVGEKYYNVRDAYRNFRMWLYRNHLDIYIDNKKSLKTIYELYCHYMDEGFYLKVEDYIDDGKKDAMELLGEINTMSLLYDFSRIEERSLSESRKTCNFEDIERNFEIYRKRNKMHVLELAAEYNLSGQTIYTIIRKVKGKFDKIRKQYENKSVNYHKGKIFEKEYESFLNSTKFFDDVDRNGKPGKPDIIAQKENDIFVFSLKNYDLEKNFWLNPTDLLPELKECRKNENGTNKYLVISVFDNNKNKTFCFLYDYDNPKDIDLKKTSFLYF